MRQRINQETPEKSALREFTKWIKRNRKRRTVIGRDPERAAAKVQ